MGLKEMVSQYVGSLSKHTGIHYVPSFNDMGTMAADDLEDAELMDASKDVQRIDQAAPTSNSKRLTNKMDSWPQFATTDLHKINKADHTRNRQHTYDMGQNVTGDARGPSVWEHILKSEKAKGVTHHSGEDRVNMFRVMDQDGDGLVSATDIQRTLRVTKSEADKLLAEADTNRDGKLSEDEYRDVLSHYGSE